MQALSPLTSLVNSLVQISSQIIASLGNLFNLNTLSSLVNSLTTALNNASSSAFSTLQSLASAALTAPLCVTAATTQLLTDIANGKLKSIAVSYTHLDVYKRQVLGPVVYLLYTNNLPV